MSSLFDAFEDSEMSWPPDFEEPCSDCGCIGYHDYDKHVKKAAKWSKLDEGLLGLKCGDCGGVLSISDDWHTDDLATCCTAWCRCCEHGCGLTHTMLYDDDLNVLAVYRGYLGVSEARYRNEPVDLTLDEIPF